MKTNFLKSILGTALAAVLFTGCVNDDDYSIPNLECNDPGLVANKQVSDIYTQATALPVLYAANDIIEARVVSSDKGGNFFKVMYLTSLDGTRGFSLAINRQDLYNEYNVGRKVFIKLQGLYTQIRNNTLQIGALYQGNVGQIAEADYKTSLINSCNTVDEETLVQEMTLAQVSDAQIGKLVELVNVQFADNALGQNYYNDANVVGGQTNHNITDATGATLIFRTSSFAEYAGLPVESKSGRIRGILTKFGATYQFIARYTTDIRLTEPRIGGEPEQPENPGNPGTTPPEAAGTLLFAGGNFNNYATFLSSVNSFGLKPYATESPANGLGGTTALRINGTPTANDYVFTVKAPAGLPTNATKITFWIKGTSTGKALSFNVNRGTSGYDVYNLSSLGSTAVTLTKSTEINSSGNGTNQYTGAINTNNTWVKVTLDLTGVNYNTTAGNDIFSFKTGNGGVYDMYVDNFLIE